MDVALVTDSAACLPAALAQEADITVLPLHVLVGEGRGGGSREVTPAEVVDLLRQGRVRVSTSRVSPGELEAAYRGLAERTGCRQIVSVHVSGGVSGTVDAARWAAGQVSDDVEVIVIDSRMVGLALGWAVLDAAEHARGGANGDAVAALVRERLAVSRAWFYVDSLEHLRRGGRLGRAQSVLGSALAIKPLLTVVDGEVGVAEKVRTRAKALARVVELVGAATEELRVGSSEVAVAIHELGAELVAEELKEALRERTGLDPWMVGLTPSLGVHTGPGTLGVVVGARSAAEHDG